MQLTYRLPLQNDAGMISLEITCDFAQAGPYTHAFVWDVLDRCLAYERAIPPASEPGDYQAALAYEEVRSADTST